MARMLGAVARTERDRRRGRTPLPYKLELMTTFACASRCKTCLIWTRYLEQPERRDDELSPEAFARIVGSVRESVRWISFTGGEVTDREDFEEIVARVLDAVGDRLALINITTNGLQPQRTAAAFQAVARLTRGIPTFVTISLDGIGDTYTAVRGVPGYEAVQASMAILRGIRAHEPHLRTGYEATISAHNAHEIDALLRVMTEAGERPTFTQAFNALQLTGGRIDVDVRQTPAGQRAIEQALEGIPVRSALDLAPKLYLLLARHWFATGQAPLPCKAGHAAVTVDPYGSVLQCNVRDAPLVSLHDFALDLKAAVRSKAYAQALAPTLGCQDCWTPCHAYPNLLHHPMAVAGQVGRALRARA